MTLNRLAYTYLIRSQLIFYATIAVCIALAPASLGDNSGLSYFGRHWLTVVPFGLGLLVAAYYIYSAAQQIRRSEAWRNLHHGLMIIAPGMVGIVIAPSISWVDAIHRIFGSVVFVTQLLLSFWLVGQVRKDLPNGLLIGLQLAGGIIALIYLSPAQGFSIQGQIIFQLAFSGILLRSARPES